MCLFYRVELSFRGCPSLDKVKVTDNKEEIDQWLDECTKAATVLGLQYYYSYNSYDGEVNDSRGGGNYTETPKKFRV